MPVPPAPMLARAGELPTGAQWSFEVKWDGVRALVDIRDGQVRVRARSGRDITAAYPELAGLAAQLDDALLDGEIVAMAAGVPSFAALAERMHVRDPARAAELAERVPVTLMVFDALRLHGQQLIDLPLQDRREMLEATGLAATHWQLSPRYSDGNALWQATLDRGLEGVVAKRLGSRYRPGVRSTDWVKVPHRLTDAFLVGGWRPQVGSDGARAPIGALLVGATAPDGTLTYVGRVGSGLTATAAAELRRLVVEVAGSPFAGEVPAIDARGARWCDPVVVVDVRYLSRGQSGRLRQSVFRGLRPEAFQGLRPGGTPQDWSEAPDA